MKWKNSEEFRDKKSLNKIEMIIENGLIKTITNKSGHYKPDFDLVKSNVTKELKSRGLSTEKINFVADE